VDAEYKMDLATLENAIAGDRRAGFEPFCVVGTAGTVNTGAIDNLEAIASICKREDIWFHVDGAFGGLCVLAEELKPRVRGIELSDSVSFDFHKWMSVQYDAGCVLVRRGDLHLEAFSMQPAYLQSAARGTAGGEPWPCNLGVELSRGFRALKIWFAIKEHGTRALGRIISQNCRQAAYLGHLIDMSPELDLLTSPALNIVCFRFVNGVPETALDELNLNIVADLQEKGIAVPSTTRIHGRVAIRAAITNHRTRHDDLRILVDSVISVGKERTAARRG
jgi:aromatic-L-amino-acid decarboxylase